MRMAQPLSCTSQVEMVLLEDLNFDLIIFSPYRSLTLYLRDADLGGEVGLRSWTVLNDSYRTDVSLLHPPHLVALACLQLACMHIVQEQQLSDAQQRQQNQMSIQQSHSPMTVKLKSWTETLIANVDMERVRHAYASKCCDCFFGLAIIGHSIKVPNDSMYCGRCMVSIDMTT